MAPHEELDWASAVQTAIRALLKASKKATTRKQDVYKYVEEHWDSLLGSRKKPKSWRSEVDAAFEAGLVRKTLKNNGDAPLNDPKSQWALGPEAAPPSGDEVKPAIEIGETAASDSNEAAEKSAAKKRARTEPARSEGSAGSEARGRAAGRASDGGQGGRGSKAEDKDGSSSEEEGAFNYCSGTLRRASQGEEASGDSSERQPPPIACPKCGKAFAEIAGLGRHRGGCTGGAKADSGAAGSSAERARRGKAPRASRSTDGSSEEEAPARKKPSPKPPALTAEEDAKREGRKERQGEKRRLAQEARQKAERSSGPSRGGARTGEAKADPESETEEEEEEAAAHAPGFACAVCGRTLMTRSGLVIHERHCKGPADEPADEPGPAPVTLSPRAPPTPSGGARSLTCPRCKKTFIAASGLVIHVKFCKGGEAAAAPPPRRRVRNQKQRNLEEEKEEEEEEEEEEDEDEEEEEEDEEEGSMHVIISANEGGDGARRAPLIPCPGCGKDFVGKKGLGRHRASCSGARGMALARGASRSGDGSSSESEASSAAKDEEAPPRKKPSPKPPALTAEADEEDAKREARNERQREKRRLAQEARQKAKLGEAYRPPLIPCPGCGKQFVGKKGLGPHRARCSGARAAAPAGASRKVEEGEEQEEEEKQEQEEEEGAWREEGLDGVAWAPPKGKRHSRPPAPLYSTQEPPSEASSRGSEANAARRSTGGGAENRVGGVGSFECTRCGQRCLSLAGLKVHSKACARNSEADGGAGVGAGAAEAVRCGACGNEFRSALGLDIHRRRCLQAGAGAPKADAGEGGAAGGSESGSGSASGSEAAGSASASGSGSGSEAEAEAEAGASAGRAPAGGGAAPSPTSTGPRAGAPRSAPPRPAPRRAADAGAGAGGAGGGAGAGHEAERGRLRGALEQQFNRWLFELKCGFSVALYGLGSKASLLTAFAQQRCVDGPVAVLLGYSPACSLRQALAALAEEALGLQLPWRGPAPHLAAIRAALAAPAAPPLYLVVHNIDGPGLRGAEAQEALAALAALPRAHLIASVDHVTAPLLWDRERARRLNFLWHEASTLEGYTRETEFARAICAAGEGGTESRLRAALVVLMSLTPVARSVYRLLGEEGLERGEGGGMTLHELLEACRGQMVLSSELALKAHLAQLRDHDLIRTRSGGAGGRERMYIALPPDALRRLLADMEGAPGPGPPPAIPSAPFPASSS
eukprot:tig00021122_g18441.t1